MASNPWTSNKVNIGINHGKIVKKRGKFTRPLMKGPASFTALHQFSTEFQPKVTIITTVYDRVTLLKTCINSVQKLKFQDLEHIIVSDCPPDEITMKILDLVQEKDNGRIMYVNLDKRYNNFGIAPSSVGLRLARGKYVCFLSDDNIYLSGHLNPLVHALDKNANLGFAYSNCLYRGRRLLNSSRPRPSRIDLGQPLFRKEIFSRFKNDLTRYRSHPWDWYLISFFIKKRVQFKHINKSTFIFRIKAYPHYRKQADS